MQTTFAMPITFYVVARQFKVLGLGSGGDITDELDKACLQVIEGDADRDPVRVFLIEMDADGIFPRHVEDVTSEARKRIAEWGE